MGSHGRHALFSDRARARPPDHPAPRAHVSGGGRGELAVLQPRGPHIGGRPRPPACRVMMMLEARWTISSWLFMIHLPSASATTIVDVRKRRRVVNDAALRSEGLSRRRRRRFGPDCAAPRSNRRYNPVLRDRSPDSGYLRAFGRSPQIRSTCSGFRSGRGPLLRPCGVSCRARRPLCANATRQQRQLDGTSALPCWPCGSRRGVQVGPGHPPRRGADSLAPLVGMLELTGVAHRRTARARCPPSRARLLRCVRVKSSRLQCTPDPARSYHRDRGTCAMMLCDAPDQIYKSWRARRDL